jgi:hypothetical protein
MAHELSRQTLYDLLWSKPKTEVAKSLGISDVALGKICGKADVPVPPRGYWAARAAGKRVIKISLPPRGLGKSDTVSIGRDAGWYYPNVPIGELPPPPVFPESMQEVVQKVRKLVGKVSVPRTLEKVHPLIAKLLEQDEERKRKVAEHSYVWDTPKFESSPAKRRLRLINTIFLAVARAGFRPEYQGQEAEQLSVRVGDVVVSFTVEPIKKTKRHDRMFDDTQTAPRLPLTIKLDHRIECPEGVGNEWLDSDKQSLETVMTDVVVSVIAFGEIILRAHAEHHHHWLIERKQEQEEAARKARELAEQKKREAQARREQARRERLFTQAKNWKQSGEIRAYIAALQKHPEAGHHAEALAHWVTWALSEADALDPLSAPLGMLLDKGEDESDFPTP